MDNLKRLSPSLANVSADFTPKRNLLFQRPMTPLLMIKEENDENQRNRSTPIRRNPFDVKAESLYFPSCSPSVFATFQRNKVDNGSFRWSIEHLSVLYPADIDETSVPDTWVDAEQEMKAQKAIDTFFSQNSIVPSPWSSSPKEGRGDKSRRRACISSMFQNVQSSDAGTQTMLSIPPNIDLSTILGNFFTYDDKDDGKSQEISRENSREESDLLSTSSLRRKLFVNDECASPCRIENKNLYATQRWSTPTVHMRTAQSTPTSDAFSSSPITPPNCSDSCNILSSPPVSPIAATSLNASFNNSKESRISSPYRPPNSPCFISSADSAMSFCIDSQDTIPFPSYSSEKQDTGYATGSISLSQNMTTSLINYGLVSRIAPVTELMEECELSSASTSCDTSFRNEGRAFGGVSLVDCAKDSQPNACSFKTYPWVPTCCSTPTKCNHL